MSDDDFETSLRAALSEKALPSSSFEDRLFSSADLLLERRRDFTRAQAARREAIRRSGATIASLGKGSLERLAIALSQLAEAFSGQPLAQAATALALLVIVILNQGHSRKATLTVADLPEFPRINNADASYEAMWLAQRKAYDKEVEDAQRESSGGI